MIPDSVVTVSRRIGGSSTFGSPVTSAASARPVLEPVGLQLVTSGLHGERIGAPARN